MIKLKDLIIETWNSDIWMSDIWNSDIWNSNIDPSNIWEGEKQTLNEMMFAQNYWVLPDGKIIEVDDHISWFTDNIESPYFHDEDGQPTNSDGSICEPEEVYEAASKMGYIRMLKPYEDEAPLNVDVDRGYPPKNIQLRNIRDFAIEKGWKLRGISED